MGRLASAATAVWVATILCATTPACGGSGGSAAASLASRLQRAVDDFRSSHLILGASVAVVDDGEIADVVSGSVDLERREPVSGTTRFRVASVTKLYLATIVLEMAERGALSLDDTVGRLGVALPESLDFAQEFTVRQLLTHTSGLAQTFTRDEDRGEPLTIADRLERVGPPACDPGRCWSYADGNYVLVEAIIEAITGRSVTEVFDDELAEPLDLDDTVLVDAAVADDPLPRQYALVNDGSGQIAEPRRLFEQSLPRSTTLTTTARDAAQFADALFNGAILQPESTSQMLDTSVMRDLPCPQRCRFEYGLGLFHFDVAGRDLVGHDGSSGALVVHDLEDDLTVAILTNGGDHAMGEFLEAVLGAVGDG